MSNARFSIIQAKAVRDSQITLAQFRTLCALGIYGDEEGWCFPNLKTLGEDLGKSKQAVSKDIKALVELGYVQTKHQYRPDGSQRGNLYRIIFDDVGGQRGVQGGSTPEVDGGQLNTVDGGSTPEVDALTSHSNDTINDPKEKRKGSTSISDEFTNITEPVTPSLYPQITSNSTWIKITSFYNLNPDVFCTLLTSVQQMKLPDLLKKDGDKCLRIAEYYANDGLSFNKIPGRIINKFDTWDGEEEVEQITEKTESKEFPYPNETLKRTEYYKDGKLIRVEKWNGANNES